jgi:hypothetical protein
MLNSIVLILLAVGLLIDQAMAVTCNSTFPYDYSSNCYRQCPWNDTLVTYLSNTSTTCLTSTPPIK